MNLDLVHFSDWREGDFAQFLADIYTGNFNPVERDYPVGYRIEYPGFTKVNIHVSQELTSALTGYMRVTNLTNNDAFERLNTLAPRPRTITFGLRF